MKMQFWSTASGFNSGDFVCFRDIAFPRKGGEGSPGQTGPAAAPDTSTNRYLGGNGDIDYDTTGNVTKIGPPSFTMRYDTFDMQVHFESHVDGNQSDHLYAYGPGDRRLVTLDTLSNVATYHLRNPAGQVVREYEVTGSGNQSTFRHQKDLIYGPDGLLATVAQTGEPHYFHKDHLGTPRAVTDANGTLVGKNDYYPFGQETPDNPQFDEKTVKFTGHQRDPHGLSDYMMGRTCLWPLRRFASVDPARDGWNLYAYTANNPIKFVDPSGFDLRLSYDFSKSSLSPAQQNAIASGIRERFRNAGVQNVQNFFPQKTLFGEVGGPPSPTRPTDRNVTLQFQDAPITSSSTALGRTATPSTKSAVTTAHTPAGGVTQLINTGAHEAGHASRALLQYDYDKFDPGSPLHPKPAEAGSVMEQFVDATVLNQSLREFSEQDAALIRKQLNAQ